MLRILINMAGDVLKFLFIWTVIILMISSVGSLLFGELPEYSNFISVWFQTFGTGMGNYNLTIFRDLSIGSIVGEGFIIVSVIINNIVMLNFVIAIQADTYSKFSETSLGIYYDGIITRIPIYEDDEYYGGLIVGTPPFNAFAILTIPFYWFKRNEKGLRRGNDIITKIFFCPLAIIFTLIFMILNLCLLPLAYVASISKKLKLLRARNSTSIFNLTLEREL